jgi:hypothetical protein
VQWELNADMWPYLLLFLVPAFQAVTKRRQMPSPLRVERWSYQWRLVFIVLVLMVGLRYQVGGDWDSYFASVEETTSLTLVEALARFRYDPADSILSWVASQSGFGVYLVNVVYATFFSWGLLSFCRKQPRPWLALTVAVPYLITVVAMGYSRQGVAIGLVMLGMVALENKNISKYVLWVALAATVHKSAVILVPMVVLAGTRHRLLTLFWVCVSTALLFGLLLKENVDNLLEGYIHDKYESSGAAIRIAMNALPALIFLVWRKRFQLQPMQRKFWTWMSLSALAFVALLYISPSSTAVDRLALYLIPLQLFVWSRVPDLLGRPGETKAVWVYAVVGYSAAVHFVWLFFATHSYLWLPYQFYPWVWLWQ